MATDEVFTYAMFNYLNLDWTSHTEAGGDTTTGEGGIPAFVGFNGGNGTRSFEYKPYSQESVIRDLTGRGYGNGFKGRHYFRIDENILLGSCNKDIGKLGCEKRSFGVEINFRVQGVSYLGMQLISLRCNFLP